MILLNFRVRIARYCLGLAREEDLVDCAHAFLDAGIYSPALGEIVTVKGANSYKLEAHFATALIELEIAPLTASEAIRELAAGYLVPLAEGACIPTEICARCYDDYAAIEHRWRPPHKFQGEIEWGPIQKMVDFYYQHEYPDELIDQINEECIAFAVEWSRAYWRSIHPRAWLTATVRSIAAAIDRDRAFDRLPILADALEEAGCTNADVLLHCRQPGEHVRGCWVVDLVLGKE